MKKSAWLTICAWAFFLGSGPTQASVIDAPHNESNGISCGSCHTYSMWWQYSPATESVNPSYNAIVNTLCMACHGNSGPAPAVAGHSGAVMGSSTYHGGLWEEGCTSCHNPHEQGQISWKQEGINPYLVTAKIDSVSINSPAPGQTTITYSDKANNPVLSVWPESTWSDKSAGNPGRGLILVHNKTAAFNTFSVISATPTQVIVKGTINPGDIDTASCPQTPHCTDANTFGLLYGQFIHKTIATPSSGNRPVKFLDPKGGFTDTLSTPPTGVCQVCHTQTHYWDTNGGNTNHNPGTNCATCHPHKDGFKPQFPSHDTFVAAQAQCTGCHSAADRVLGIHKGLCGHCHSVIPALASPADRSNVIDIAKGDCFTCHGSNFNHPNATHAKVTADAICSTCHNTSNIISNTHKGNCLGCHQSTHPVVINAITTKTGGSCLTCHDGTSDGAFAHGTTPATVAPQHDKFLATASCASCHDVDTAEKRITIHPACTTCHGYTGSKLNPTDVANAIATGKGANGTEITCQTCHLASHDTELDHNHRKALPACAACHSIASQTAIDTLHKQDCGTCHGYNGTKLNPTVVAAAINTGKGANGTDVNCQTCHTAGHNTDSDHNHRKALPACASCHSIASQTAIDTLHKQNCATCHGYNGSKLDPTVVANAINTGKGVNGTDVDCQTCHTTPHNTDADHDHRTVETGCAACHAVETATAIDTLHGACDTCHSSAKSAVVNAIEIGKGVNGTDVTCVSCHTGTETGAIVHGTTNTTAAPLHDNFADSTSCAACHVTGTTEERLALHPACTTCHSSTLPAVAGAIATGRAGTSIDCETCHNGDTTTGALGHGITNASAAVTHDMFNASTTCASCHVSNTAEERLALHPACTTCHASAKSAVSAAISSGRAGTAVTCETCHNGDTTTGALIHGTTNATAATAHDMFNTTTPCAVCHISGTTEQRLAIHPACTTCHASSSSVVTATIASGRAGNAISCTSCHTSTHLAVTDQGILHTVIPSDCSFCHVPNVNSPAHNNLTTAASCSSCHATGTFLDIVAAHQDDCLKCHLSAKPLVIDAIVAAKTGTMVNCETCHTSAAGGAFSHGATNSTAAAVHNMFNPSTTCAACHESGTAEQRLALHPACTVCHTSTKSHVVAAIASGRAGSPVTCETCHSGSTINGAFVHGTTNATAATVHDKFTASATCAVCHVSGSTEQRLSLHPACTVCHASTKSDVMATIASGRAGTTVTCETCHTGNESTGALVHGTTNATAATVHDMFNGSTTCAACHISETAEQRLALHPTCTACHSSTKSEIIGAIASGRSGSAVSCETCHTGDTTTGAFVHGTTNATAATVHDMFNGSTACAACHISGSTEERLALHPACTVCHSSTKGSIVGAISSGRSGTPISCETCHTGDTTTGAFVHGTTNDTAAVVHDMFNASANCSACHLSDAAEQRLALHPACSTCHNSTKSGIISTIASGRAGTAISCETCHTGDTTTGAFVHGTTNDTAAMVHDMFTASSTCASCHLSGSAEERLALHPACATCHSSTKSAVATAIATGRAGTAITCESCHNGNTSTGALVHGTTNNTAAVAHDMFNASNTCSSCHVSTTAEERLSLHPACSTCHASTKSAVSSTIASGRAGTAVSCETCHNGDTTTGALVHGTSNSTAAVVHDMFNTATPCAVCHISGTTEQRLAIHPTCTTCHASSRTSVIATIASGRAGNPLSCNSCHTSDHRAVTNQGILHTVIPSNCTFCHVPNVNAPAHNNLTTSASCSGCHATGTFLNIVAAHQDDCLKCHLSDKPLVIDAIVAAKTGTVVNCETCHTSAAGGAFVHGATNATAAALHDKFNQSAVCAACHDSGTAEQRLALHPACTTCHASTKSDVAGTIASGRAGTEVTCETCHSGNATTGAMVHGTTNDSAGTAHDKFNPSNTCATCHASCTVEQRLALHPACTACHASTKSDVVATIAAGRAGTTVTCETCHTGNTTGAFTHGTTNATAATVHDMFNGSATCGPCHLSGSAEQRLALHPACTTCHSSIKGDVAASIATGRGGTAVSCETCHTGTSTGAFVHGTTNATAASAHNLFNGSTACGPCHLSGSAEQRLALHPACTTCHSSIKSEIVGAISSGRNGTPVSCETCHTGDTTTGAFVHGTTNATAATVHDQFSASANCSSCHVSSTAEQRLALHSACTTCHSSTKSAITGAISSGRNGTAVSCETCHTGDPAAGAFVHGTTNATAAAVHNMFNASATCAPCHASNNAEERLALHPACATCHASTMSAVATAISTGRAGTAISCETCHTGNTSTGVLVHGTTNDTAAMVHDMFNRSSTCASCHISDTAEERLALHPDCATCHTSNKSAVSTTIASGRAGTAVSCETCHDGTTNGALVHGTSNSTAAAAHDMFNNSTPCALCHISGTAEQRLAIHQTCATCHASTRTAVIATIASGRAGNPLSCTSCHTSAHLPVTNQGVLHIVVPRDCTICHVPNVNSPAHNNLTTVASCSGCHVSGTFLNIVAAHQNDCLMCHLSANPLVIDAIVAAKSGTVVNCETCHTAVGGGAFVHGATNSTAAALHDKFTSSSTCATCHDSGTSEQRLALHPACATCHASTKSDIVATISSGVAGTEVTCETCHSGNANTGAFAHGTTNATAPPVHNMLNASAACITCHDSDTGEQRLALHPNCTTCHSSSKISIVEAIAAGRAGTVVSCETCHTGNTTTGAFVH